LNSPVGSLHKQSALSSPRFLTNPLTENCPALSATAYFYPTYLTIPSTKTLSNPTQNNKFPKGYKIGALQTNYAMFLVLKGWLF